jgi:hypothetical protein
MTKIFKLSLLTSALIISNIAHAANIEKLFLDKSYWTKFNWDKIESSEIFLDEKTESREPPEVPKKLVYEKFRDLEIEGITFRESFERNTLLTKNNRKIHLLLKTSEPITTEQSCVSVADLYIKNFGRKYELTEYTSGVNGIQALRSGKKYHEWIFGNTNIQVKCTEVTRDMYFVSAIYSPNTPENRVQKPIKLDCERSFQLVGSNETKSNTPMNITILQDEMNVLNADGNLIGKVEQLTNSYIKIVLGGEEAKLVYSISRLDGSLSGNLTRTSSNEITANFGGSCKKRVNEIRKF